MSAPNCSPIRPVVKKYAADIPQEVIGYGAGHKDLDIRSTAAVDALFAWLGKAVRIIVHTAAQSSHDRVAREPLTGFGVNAILSSLPRPDEYIRIAISPIAHDRLLAFLWTNVPYVRTKG